MTEPFFFTPALKARFMKAQHDRMDLHGTRWITGMHDAQVVERMRAALKGEEEWPELHEHATNEIGCCVDCDAAALLTELGYEEPDGSV